MLPRDPNYTNRLHIGDYTYINSSLDIHTVIADGFYRLSKLFGIAAETVMLRWNGRTYETLGDYDTFPPDHLPALLAFANESHAEDATNSTLIRPISINYRDGYPHDRVVIYMRLIGDTHPPPEARLDFGYSVVIALPPGDDVSMESWRELREFERAFGLAITNADLYEKSRREYRELEAVRQTWEHLWQAVENQQKALDKLLARNQALYDIGIAINASLNQRDVLATIVSEAVKLLQASRGAIALWDGANHELQLLAEHRATDQNVDLDTFPRDSAEAREPYLARGNADQPGARSDLVEGIFGPEATARLHAFLSDYWHLPPYEAARIVSSLNSPADTTEGPTVAASIGWQGQMLGVIVLNDFAAGRAFSAEEKHTLMMVANQAAVAIENARLFRDVTEERNRSRAILNSIADGVFTTDLDLRITSFNPAAEQVTSCVGDNVVGGRYETVLGLTDRDGQALTSATSPCQQAITGRAATEPQIVRVGLPDGEFLLIALVAAPIIDSYGEITGTVGVFRDVTREQAVARMKDEFVSLVSHELRTPMASVLGFSELMLTRSLNETKTRQYTEIIHKEAQRLSNLINDFLDIQRMEAGRQVYNFKAVPITQLMRPVQNLFRNEDNHRLTLHVPNDLPDLWVDADRLIQTLTNLVGNAIKYSPDGGDVLLSARLTLENMVEISVQDHGLGIPDDSIDKLFSKFYRVDNSDRRSIGGTGLGLAISREIVEAHGGHVWVRSKEGIGSTFFFTVHAAARDGNNPAPVTPIAASTPPPAPTPVAHSDTPTVLIVEDDASLGGLIGTYLEEAGYSYQLVTSAPAALDALKSFSPVAIVVDIVLPGETDGWDLLIQLKNHPLLARVPIIISTVLDNRLSGTQLGAVDFLRKPVDIRRLLDVLNGMIAPNDRRSVLIIDDDASLRHMLREVLIGNDFKVITAAGGARGLHLALTTRPTAIVLDLMMPHMDGFEVLSKLRADRRTIDVPVVVITAKELTQREQDFLHEGVAFFLTKNETTPQRIRDLISDALATRREVGSP